VWTEVGRELARDRRIEVHVIVKRTSITVPPPYMKWECPSVFPGSPRRAREGGGCDRIVGPWLGGMSEWWRVHMGTRVCCASSRPIMFFERAGRSLIMIRVCRSNGERPRRRKATSTTISSIRGGKLHVTKSGQDRGGRWSIGLCGGRLCGPRGHRPVPCQWLTGEHR
jgi:hypothetical protein